MDKIMEYFIEEPEREFYVRELARIIKKAPTTISKNLSRLKQKNILRCKKKYNHLLFKANTENPEFKELKRHYNIAKIIKSGLLEYLNDSFNYPEAIVLFGSFGKGENARQSDVDILMITPKKKEVKLDKFEKKLGHKVQLFKYSTEDIEKMKTKNKELVNSFINGIMLEGYWEIFK